MRNGILIALVLTACDALSMPTLTGVSPLAVVPGQAVDITLQGSSFTDDIQLWTSFAGKTEFVKRIDAKQAVFRVTAPTGTPTHVGALRVYDRTGISAPILMMVDTLSSTTATSTDKTKPVPLKIPVAVDGRMAGVNSFWFSFNANAGQKVSIEVYSERIASKADPVIRLTGPDGRAVGYADDDDVLGSDAGLIYQVKTAGSHRLELRDIQYRSGGPFRLRIGSFPVWPALETAEEDVLEQEPNDGPRQANSLELGRVIVGNIEEPGARDYYTFNGRKGQWASFRALSRRIGSPSYIYLELLDATGKAIANTGTGFASETILRHKLPVDGRYTLLVEEQLRRGGPRFTYRIDSRVSKGEFSLRLNGGVDAKKKPVVVDRFWAIAGQRLELNVQVDRSGYEGPITLATNKEWQLNANVVKEKSKEAKLQATVPVNAKPGELHELTITGTGEGEGAAKAGLNLFEAYRIRWPQMAFPPAVLLGSVPMVVIEPTKISMAGVKIKLGAKVKVRITTTRPPPPLGAKSDPKPIAIEIKNLPDGVTAPEKITVDAKKDFVELELSCAAGAKQAKAEVIVVAKSTYRGTDWVKESLPVPVEVLAK